MPQYIDLTIPINNKLKAVHLRQVKTVEKDGWNASVIETYSHAGTHMDAPVHFNVSPQTIDEIPLDRCIGASWLADIKNVEPQMTIHVDDLGDLKTQIKPGENLIIRTGWSKYVYDTDKYRNQLPRISEDLALWCARKKINMLGVEPPSVADVNNLKEITNIHRILLEAGIIIIEGLTNLEKIKHSKFTFGAIPLKIEQGDGSPVRAFAIENLTP